MYGTASVTTSRELQSHVSAYAPIAPASSAVLEPAGSSRTRSSGTPLADRRKRHGRRTLVEHRSDSVNTTRSWLPVDRNTSAPARSLSPSGSPDSTTTASAVIGACASNEDPAGQQDPAHDHQHRDAQKDPQHAPSSPPPARNNAGTGRGVYRLPIHVLRAQSAVARSPSSRATLGVHPNDLVALVISGHRCIGSSPGVAISTIGEYSRRCRARLGKRAYGQLFRVPEIHGTLDLRSEESHQAVDQVADEA